MVNGSAMVMKEVLSEDVSIGLLPFISDYRSRH